jgi:hypothetical protein
MVPQSASLDIVKAKIKVTRIRKPSKLKAYLSDQKNDISSRDRFMLSAIKNIVRQNKTFMQSYRGRNIFNAAGKLQLERTLRSKCMSDVRGALAQIEEWIDEEAVTKSVYSYGLMPHTRAAMNKRLVDDTTIIDVVQYFVQLYGDGVAYLEIGVSVGKTFWSVVNAVPNASATALDIEDINPVIAARFELKNSEVFPTTIATDRNTPYRESRYHFGKNNCSISYVAGDVYDAETWRRMQGRKFQVIFSDAAHSPEAILKEWDEITSRGLLDDNGFTVIWDDLVSPGMRAAFDKIAQDAIQRYGLTKQNVCFTHVWGWVGNAEPHHPIGIISTRPFDK